MGIPVVERTHFELADTAGAPVALINESAGEEVLRGPRSASAAASDPARPNLPWFTVVGVLKDVKQGGVAESAGTELYMLTEQLPKARRLRAQQHELRRPRGGAAVVARQ